MKKIFLSTLVLLLSLSVSVFAQYKKKHKKRLSSQSSQITYGIMGGLNVSNVYDAYYNSFGDYNFRNGAKLGFNLGVFVDIPLIPKVHFQPEFNYSLKGYKAIADDGIFTRNYNMIDIPLLFKYYPIKHLYIYVGPQMSVKISTYDTWTTNNSNFIQRYQRGNNNINNVYAGIATGVGIDLGSHWICNLGYAADFSKNYTDYGLDTPGFRNEVISFDFGYRF